MLGCCCLAVIVFLCVLLYVAFFWKINWIRDLTNHKKKLKRGGNYLGPKARKVGELPPVYPNGWFALAESWQIQKGKVKHIAALGENFAVFRTEKGIVSILDAYCPHLGANMGEGGRVKGECLECPFHGWVFRGDNGVCESISYAEKVPVVAKTKAWRSCEVNQLIFVWYHAESAEPTWEPQPHPKISSGIWRNHGRNEFLINCHIQDIPENGADLAHLEAVHGPAMLIGRMGSWFTRHSWTNAAWTPHSAARRGRKTDVELSSTGSIEMKTVDDEDEEDVSGKEDSPENSQSHRASMKLSHKLLFFERYGFFNLHVEVQQIGPAYVELLLKTSIGPVYIIQTVTPVAPLVQRVLHLAFSYPIMAPVTSIIFLAECLMFERDVAVWNHKRYERRPILVREERTILAYRRWYTQFYSEHSPNYRTAMESLQW